MGDFDLKPSFPVASVADLYANRSKKEAEMRAQQQQQLVQGLQAFGQGVDSLVQRRQQMAQALASAKLFAQTEEGKKLMAPSQAPTPGYGSELPAGAQGPSGPVTETQSPIDMATLQTALQGLDPKDLLKSLAPQTQQVFTIDQLTGKLTPTGAVPAKSKVVPLPRINPQQTDYVTPEGQPTYWDPKTKTYKVATVEGAGGQPGGRLVTKKGDESAVGDATLLVNQIPNIKVMFDAYRNSKNPRLQSTPVGRLLNPAGKQAESSLKLAAFTFGGKNLTANEKDVVFDALFPSWTDNDESRGAKETLLTDFMTGKIDLVQAANLLGPAGSKMRSMLERIQQKEIAKETSKPKAKEQPKTDERSKFVEGALAKGYSKVEAEHLAEQHGFKK